MQRMARQWLRQALRLCGCVAVCAPLCGCIGLPVSAAGNPLYAVMTPMATAIGMGLGADMALRTTQVGTIERAADITPQEKAHFESLDCAGLREMESAYTPSGAALPANSTYAMQAVGARLELLARLRATKGC